MSSLGLYLLVTPVIAFDLNGSYYSEAAGVAWASKDKPASFEKLSIRP
jgi:hypothetical protein